MSSDDFEKLKITENSSDEVNVTINDLNEDCLISIFEHLSIKEKLRIESVNKLWNRVSKLSWSKIKSIRIESENNEILPREKLFEKRKKIILTNFCLKILKRSNIYLNILVLDASYIKKYLEYNKFLEELPKYCQNLTHFSVHEFYCRIITDQYLQYLFSIMIKLESITLKGLRVDGSCFQSLNANQIKKLSIFGCKFDSDKFFDEFSSKLKNLHTLELNDFSERVNKIINALLKNGCNNIIEIDLGVDYEAEIKNLPIFLATQQNLHKLKLAMNANEEIMKSLPADHLEELDIKYHFDGTKQYILNLKYLKQLENLKVFKTVVHHFTDEYIENLIKSITDNIKEIHIQFREDHSTDKQQKSLHQLPNLRLSITQYN